jgi:hypothetical protein
MPALLDASTLAARTRTAQQILDNAELRALYESVGGLASDLEAIRNSGLAAEAGMLAQSGARSAGVGATADILQSFVALQKEYVAVMAAVQAVRRDLEQGGADHDTLAALDGILVNEAQVVIHTEALPDGSKGRKASRSASQEALRAEIAKDAAALLALEAAQKALTKRKVTKARLQKLKEGADELAGKLAERAVKKGEAKAKTAAKVDAADAQSSAWNACYRLLALVGQKDTRVAQLLREAARPRKKKEAEKK